MRGAVRYLAGGARALLLGVALHAAAVSAHDDHGVAAPTPDGGLSWDVLKGARAVEWHDARASRTRLRPEFTPDILAQDDRVVTMAGYMMATDDGAPRQSRFILFEFQPDCLFHMTMGPTGYVDVRVDEAVPMTDRPVIVQGKLRLVREGQGGVFYRIDHGRIVTAS